MNYQQEQYMSEPASSTAGGIALWKLAASLFGAGVLATTLGFLVLWPKTPREALARVFATMLGSALLGPVMCVLAFSHYPSLFDAAQALAVRSGQPDWYGIAVICVPLVCMAGLPFWWLLGAVVLWFENRKGKDLGQLAADARADVGKVVSP